MFDLGDNLRSSLDLWCLIPLSTIFQLNQGGQFFRMQETEVPGEKQQPATCH